MKTSSHLPIIQNPQGDAFSHSKGEGAEEILIETRALCTPGKHCQLATFSTLGFMNQSLCSPDSQEPLILLLSSNKKENKC